MTMRVFEEFVSHPFPHNAPAINVPGRYFKVRRLVSATADIAPGAPEAQMVPLNYWEDVLDAKVSLSDKEFARPTYFATEAQAAVHATNMAGPPLAIKVRPKVKV